MHFYGFSAGLQDWISRRQFTLSKSAKIFPNIFFSVHPPLNILAPCISMASVQNSQHRKQNGHLENLNILQLQDARKTHFPTFSMIWATFCTHLNHCYLYVLFISQPKSTNFQQNLTRSLHFIGWLPKWEEHLDRLECEQLQLLTACTSREVNFCEINSHEINSYGINSRQVNCPRDQVHEINSPLCIAMQLNPKPFT